MTRLLFAAALATAFAGSAAAATYKIDPRHAVVHFTYSHMGWSNQLGRLHDLSGEVQYDAKNPAASSIRVELPMSSISTGVDGLDKHLSSADFFDVAQFPTASFRSKRVSQHDANHLELAGDLTMHGVTRPATFQVTVNKATDEKAGFDAVGTIKRSEFGVGGMVPMVPDEVELHISLEAGVPKEAPAAAPEKKG
jgi:polyisoprenoid-binding protein YceI